MPSLLLQRLQLDVADAKAKYLGKLKHEVDKLEQKLVNTRHRSLHNARNVPEPFAESESEPSGGALAVAGGAAPGVVGTLFLGVKWLRCEKEAKVYVVVNVEDEELKSPVAFKDKEAEEHFTFEVSGRFAITDVCGHVSVRVYASNLLKVKDKLLGRVVLPVRSLLPHQNGHRRGGFGLGASGLYRLYPARLGTDRPVPGQICALKTGLESDAFDASAALALTHEFRLLPPYHERAVWPLYFGGGEKEEQRRQRRRAADARRRSRRSSSLQSLSATPQAVLDSVTEIKRNRSRIASVAAQIAGSLPVQLLLFLRSWETPAASALACLAVLAAARWMPAHALPWAVLAGVAALALLSKRTALERHTTWVLWDKEVTLDPDIGKTTFQRFTTVIDKMDDAGKALGSVAEAMEKAVNAFTFADEAATMGVLIACCAAALAWSALVHVSAWASINPLGVCGVAVLVLGAGPGPRPTADAEGKVPGARGSRSAGRLLRNLYRTVPSHDDLGSAWVASTQQIGDDEEQVHDDDEMDDDEVNNDLDMDRNDRHLEDDEDLFACQ